MVHDASGIIAGSVIVVVSPVPQKTIFVPAGTEIVGADAFPTDIPEFVVG